MSEELLNCMLGIRVLSRRLKRFKRSKVPLTGGLKVWYRQLGKLVLMGKSNTALRLVLLYRCHIRQPDFGCAEVEQLRYKTRCLWCCWRWCR